MLNRVSQKMERIFNSGITVFEHGSLTGGSVAGNTIEHAHLHIIPKRLSMSEKLLKDGNIIRGINSLEEIYNMNTPYLYFDDGQIKGISPVQNTYQSQYLRIIAYSLLYPKKRDKGWDWRKHEHPERLRETLDKLRS